MKHLKVLAALLVIMLTMTAAGCSSAPPNPETTVKNYWSAVITGNYSEANKYLSQEVEANSPLESLLPKDSEELVNDENAQLFLKRITLTTNGHQIDGNNATVDVAVTWPDLTVFFSKFISEAMGTAFSLALSGAEQEEIDAALEPIFISILEETPDIITEHQASLILEDGEWKLTGSPFPDAAENFNLSD